MINSHNNLETKIKKIRLLTTILLAVPYFFLLLQFADSCFFHALPGGAEFWALFCFTLLPVSVLILTIHLFLGRTRRRHRLKVNELDNVKIFVGIAGSLAGLLLWGLLYIL